MAVLALAVANWGEAMSAAKSRKKSRDGSGFAAMPFLVLDSPGYLGLPHPARALLLELARQYTGANNGRLVLCDKFLAPRGWKSSDVINRAKRQLLDSGLIQETRKGARPNKAAWYALTWQRLDRLPEMDIQPAGFARGAYMQKQKATPVKRSHSARIAPPDGDMLPVITPSDGAMQSQNTPSLTPPNGDYLDVAIYSDGLAQCQPLEDRDEQAVIVPANDNTEQATASHPPLAARSDNEASETRELDEDKAGWVWDEVAGEWMPPAPARATGKARAWAQQEMRRFGV